MGSRGADGGGFWPQIARMGTDPEAGDMSPV